MIKRELSIFNMLNSQESYFIFGARGSGKSALIRQGIERLKNVVYIDLLKEAEFLSYLQFPSSLRANIIAEFANHKNLIVVIDEVQRIPALLNEVHSAIEEFPGRIQFILSGSSARKLKRDGANLLAGRAIVENLYPFTYRELELPLNQVLQFGSLPKPALNPKIASRFLRTYVETYLKEEIKQESLVRKLDTFVRFLDVAAQYNAEPVNFSKIATAIQSTHTSVENYFSILEDTLIAYRIDGWSQSVKKQLLQAPKFYFFDCGVLNAVRGELRTEVKLSSYRYGKLFETMVINEIIRLNKYKDLALRLNYWRTDSGKEVDLVISRGYQQPLCAIEIKSAADAASIEPSGLQSFAEDYPHVPRFCFANITRKAKTKNITYLPWKEGIETVIAKL
jgi:predicted AAA+ superfamily ATPase